MLACNLKVALSGEKTLVTHADGGFVVLGFHIRPKHGDASFEVSTRSGAPRRTSVRPLLLPSLLAGGLSPTAVSDTRRPALLRVGEIHSSIVAA